MCSRGYVASAALRRILWEDKRLLWWDRQNVIVFTRGDDSGEDIADVTYLLMLLTWAGSKMPPLPRSARRP